MYFTSGNDRAFEQPQPRPEQPDEAAPGLENSVLENPTSDNPTPGNPTLENPMQLNKDISSKEKTTTDVSITDSIPILSRPFPSEDEAAQPPERKGTGAKSQSAIEIYREIIMDNIEYEHLCQHAKGIDRETLDEIVDLLVETVCSVRKTIRIIQNAGRGGVKASASGALFSYACPIGKLGSSSNSFRIRCCFISSSTANSSIMGV